MIISRAPLRISFLGGGTDYSEYFHDHGGVVIATAINKFSMITLTTLNDLWDHKVRLSYSKVELVGRADQLQHVAVREVLKYLDLSSHIEINCYADLPARTGLGSSGSFIVALLQAVHTYQKRDISPAQIAQQAIEIEKDIMKIYVGCQDQYIAAVGGFNLIRFGANREIKHEPIVMSKERKEQLNKNLMLFYSGLQRSASETVQEQVEKTAINVPYLAQMKDLTFEAAKVLQSSAPLKEFGRLLDEGWKLKQSLSSKITNNVINEMYSVAQKAGAVGGKLLGAGGGGFVLLYVEPEHQAAVRKALSAFKEVSFKFEDSGCQVVGQWE